MDTSFRLAAVDAYHLVIPGQTYWRSFVADNRASSPRFMLKPGWRTVYAHRVETALVRVTLADGSVGWGEATEPICPEVVCRLCVQLLGPLAAGTEFPDPGALWDFGYDLNRGRGHSAGYQLLALAALDIAVWDALGRRNQAPVAAMLSERTRRQVPAYLSGIRRATVDERVRLLRELTDAGLPGAKIFVDSDTAATLREVEALRGAVPGSWRLMVDALWSYESVDDAGAAKLALAEHGVEWLECPLLPEDIEGHRQLTAMPGTAVALGENFFTHHQVRQWAVPRALDILQPDIGRTGFSDGSRQADIARASGISVTAHMGSGSPVAQAAALQFGAAMPSPQLAEFQMDLGDALPAVFDSGWRYRDGAFTLPDRHGLGVEVDESALLPHCAGVERWSAH